MTVISPFFFKVLVFLFVIGILVFVHELGHFLIAKWRGVKVERFSLGFGKKLLGFRRGETEYLISALPLGGYVKMFGEGGDANFIIERIEKSSDAERAGFKPGDKVMSIHIINDPNFIMERMEPGSKTEKADSKPGEKASGADELKLDAFSKWREVEASLTKNPEKEYVFTLDRDEKILKLKTKVEGLEGIKGFSAKEYPRSFSNQSIIGRLMIVVAGPFMNFALPFLFLPIAFIAGVKVPAYLERPPVVGYVEPGSAASEALFQKGDEIIEVNGKEVKTWRDASIAFQLRPDAMIGVKVKREGEVETLEVKATSSSEGMVSIGLSEYLDAKVGSVRAGTPAEAAGLKKGDRIVSVNGDKIADWYQMSSIIREKANEEVMLVIEREGSELEVKITPEPLLEKGQGAIGIAPQIEEKVEKYGVVDSILLGIKKAATTIVEVTVLLFTFLYSLITGGISLGAAGKSIAGPLLIGDVAGSAAERGIGELLQFTSFISINLAIINLFPIPMLDGGHVLYLAIESIKKRPLSQRALEISQRIGFTFLIGIMFLAIYNDISRLKGSIIESISRLMEAFK